MVVVDGAMASFSEENFVKKLSDLNNSQQSIQTLSLWLIHHRKHSKTIVDVWIGELRKARPPKKLTFLYLANDVIQNSKKKGPEFSRDFRSVLPDGYRDAARDADDKTKSSMERMLNIWVERNVFEADFVDKVKRAMAGEPSSTTTATTTTAKKGKDPRKGKSSESQVEDEKKTTEKRPADNPKKAPDPPKKKKKVELSLREEIELEMQEGPGEPPTPEDLIKALSDLENSASSDASVRERIAALPPEVSDVSLLEKLTDTGEADALAKTVDEACSLLASYNARLADELLERKRVAKMLRNYIQAQKAALAESEQKLQEYKTRLEKVDAVHKELKSHVQSLPDLTLLPDVTGGLAPLPSAGDLFSSSDKD